MAESEEHGKAGDSRCSRLTPAREREIHEAVLALLCEVGYDALTMDAVAARARSSKATFYRWWRSKPGLVTAAVCHQRSYVKAVTDTGSLRGDLREIARRSGEPSCTRDIAVVNALRYAVRTDPELADAVYEQKVEPGMDIMRQVIDRAVHRGEVAPDNPALVFAPHVVFGASITRPVVERIEADTAFLERWMDAVVLPLLSRH